MTHCNSISIKINSSSREQEQQLTLSVPHSCPGFTPSRLWIKVHTHTAAAQQLKLSGDCARWQGNPNTLRRSDGCMSLRGR